MNWSQWLLALWLFTFCSHALHAETPEESKALNLAQLLALSNNSFRIQVTNSGTIRLKGQWPALCAEKAQLRSQRSMIGIGLRIFVNTQCLELLHAESRSLSELPQSSLSSLKLARRIEKGEPVYIESLKPHLNLDVDMNEVNRRDPHSTSPLLQETYAPSSSPGSPASVPQLAGHASASSVTFRRCNPNDYGSNDPHLCYGRHGLDLNTDIPIGGGAKIRGSTIMDFVIPEKVSSPLGNDIGVKLQINYDGTDTDGAQ